MFFVLDEQLGNEILNYLKTKPWVEVNHLIAGLSQLKTLVPKEETKPEDGIEIMSNKK